MGKIVDPTEFRGWKYHKYKNRFNYVEWVYMNLVQDDIAAILTYGVASEFAPGTVVARIYVGDNVIDIRDYAKNPTILDPSEDDSSIRIDDNSILVNPLDKDRFYIKGRLADSKHNLEWNLTYERILPQINAMDAEPVGWFHNRLFSEWLSWQVKMPAAKITGKLNVDGKEYDVNTLGYMDSNWGQWLIIDAHWNWLQTCGMHEGKPYSVASVEVRNSPSCGDLYVATKDKTLRFFKNKREFEFRHKEWEEDKATGHMRPTLTELTGRSLEGYQVELTAKNIMPYALVQNFPAPFGWLAEWDMLESLVKVEGVVKDPDGRVMFEVDSKGFKEYGTTGWIPGLRRIGL